MSGVGSGFVGWVLALATGPHPQPWPWVLVAVIVGTGLALVAYDPILDWWRRRCPAPSDMPAGPPVEAVPTRSLVADSRGRLGLLNRLGGVADVSHASFGEGLDTAVDNQGEVDASHAKFGSGPTEPQ